MNNADWSDMFERTNSPDIKEKMDSYVPDDIGKQIHSDDYIDYNSKIAEMKQKAKEAEQKYKKLIDTLDLSDDDQVEEFTKQELTKAIIIEQGLASKVSTMLDIVLLQLQNDPFSDKNDVFINMVTLQTKINGNVVKYTEKVNKVINDRKNADRQELRVNTMINNTKNEVNQTNILGGEGAEEKVLISLSDLGSFAKTGEIEAVQKLELKEGDDFEVIE